MEKELTYDKFVEWTQPTRMDLVEVHVKIPRFKMEEEYSLKNVLVSMGMVDAFSDSLSDFSGRRLDCSPCTVLFLLVCMQFLIVLYITAG